jgi:hypothetical protein
VEKGLKGRDYGGNINNVQYKSNWNCIYDSPTYNEYFLIKKLLKKIYILSPEQYGLLLLQKSTDRHVYWMWFYMLLFNKREFMCFILQNLCA